MVLQKYRESFCRVWVLCFNGCDVLTFTSQEQFIIEELGIFYVGYSAVTFMSVYPFVVVVQPEPKDLRSLVYTSLFMGLVDLVTSLISDSRFRSGPGQKQTKYSILTKNA